MAITMLSGMALGSAMVISYMLYGTNPYCIKMECCDEQWILQNTSGFQASLKTNLFGQHLAEYVVYGALKGHITHASKPLVLSFHGASGTGKTYVSEFIAKYWFRKGTESQYFHFLSASKDFYLNSDTDKYKAHLQELVYKAAKQCKHSIFIFDEIDQFDVSLLNSIRSYLEYHDGTVDGVDFKNTIFIFLSNTGQNVIGNLTKHYFSLNKSREMITILETEQALKNVIEKGGGGLSSSKIIEANLVSHFVPFFPLTRSHVRKCIRKEVLRRNISLSNIETMIDDTADQLTFIGPEDFAPKGCKDVYGKVSLVVAKYELDP